MKKKLIRKIAAGVIAAFALFSNISCNNNIDTEIADQKVMIKPVITLGSERSIFPDVTFDKLENIALKFECGTQQGTIAIYDSYEKIKDAVVTLDGEDSYKFQMTAKCGHILLKANVDEAKYTASETPTAVSFKLAYDLATAIAEGDGTVSAKFSYAKAKEISEATINLYKYNADGSLPQYSYNYQYYSTDTSNADGSHYIAYEVDNVPAGIYELQFDIKAADGTSASYKNSIYVAGDCETVENYEIKDDYWMEKDTIYSVMYTNTSKHFKAEATADGIVLTAKYIDDTDDIIDVDIEEEKTKVCIKLEGKTDWNTVNILPSAENKEVKILFPFTTKDKLYAFNFTVYDSNWMPSTEKVIVKATATNEAALKIFDDAFDSKYAKMSLTASDTAYEVKLNYDWRKLFAKVDSSVFSYFICSGSVWAGDYTWQNNEQFHFVGNRYTTDDWGTIDLLTETSVYNELLNGISIDDPDEIKTIKEKGSYFADSSCSFKIKDNPVTYSIKSINSNEAKAPSEERITISYKLGQPDETYDVPKSYKKDKIITLSEPYVYELNRSFAGWYTTADYLGDAVTEYDCSEDITLYAKWNLKMAAWQTIYYGNQSQNWHDCNVILNDAIEGGFTTALEEGKSYIVTLKGTLVSDYEGPLAVRLYNKDWGQLAFTWVNSKAYTAGDEFTADITLNCEASCDDVENIKFALSDDCQPITGTFELADWSVAFDAEPVKVTLVNTATDAETSAYYHKGVKQTLPTEYTDGSLVLNSWYTAADCSGTAITEVTPTADTTVYAKMDIKFSDGTWVNPTLGTRDGHYAAGFYLNDLKNIATVDSSFDDYKLVQGDKVKISFTGKAKQAYGDEFFLSISDPGNEWIYSCCYKKYTAADAEGVKSETWDPTQVGTVAAGTEVTYVIETEITQEEFKSNNPYVSFGYNYSEKNNKENSFSDWTIELSLTKSAAE